MTALRGVDTATAHKCSRHIRYRMDCKQYAEVKERAAGRCEVCGIPEPVRTPHIDHDHRFGSWAVRGMVCPPCNQTLRYVDRGALPSAEIRAYLERPHWPKWYEPEPFRLYRIMEDNGELSWRWWFPCPDDLWNAALDKARREGTSVSAAVIEFLKEWVR